MKRRIFVIILSAMCIVPAYAVFNERNITRTISVLRHELHLTWQDKKEQDRRHENTSQMAEVQHHRMVSTVKRINEMTLILYSQDMDFTLDQTYAMEGVKKEYEKFNTRRRPKYLDSSTIDAEIERYQRLIEALRVLPPRLDAIEDIPNTLRQETDYFDLEIENLNSILDSLLFSLNPAPLLEEPKEGNVDGRKNLVKEMSEYGWKYKRRFDAADSLSNDSFVLSPGAQEDRDSCIAYARDIIRSFSRTKERIEKDQTYFDEMSRRLQQTYDYAKLRFEEIQKYIFVTGQENYFSVLSNLRKYSADTFKDMEKKYGSGYSEQDRRELRGSQWRGLVLLGTTLYSLSHLLAITLLVLLVFYVFLRKVKPFNTAGFRQVRPVVVMLAVSVMYSLLLTVRIFYPMSNSMSVAARLALVFFWFAVALLLSLLIGLKKEDVRSGVKAFMPVLVLGIMVMFCRAMFLPDKMINITLAPILLVFLAWQIHETRKFMSKEYRSINRLLMITVAVFGLSLVLSLYGFSMLALMFIMWWIFQVATFATLTSLTYLLRYYSKKGLARKKERYAVTHKMVNKDEDGDYIRVTWMYDLICRALIPMAGVLSVLGCIWLALGVFNLSETCNTIFYKSFFDFKNTDGNPILQVSLVKLANISAFVFLFRYINYLVRSLYRVNKFEKMISVSGSELIRKNDINLTLAYNIIGILIWGLFLLYSISILKIPLGAISIVFAGLATGIGLALKDVLNNFIYGIQLMSGRMRVGDMIECDGIRGTVEKISYQSTEIHTVSDAMISFTNSTLFNKNFQNLTKNSPYEYVSIVVSISYWEEVDKVRKLIMDALEDYTKKRDKYGRYLVEQKGGIWITFDSFHESRVDLAIKQKVLVESKGFYVSSVKELIYKLFKDNGIVVPLPQQEVSIMNLPND